MKPGESITIVSAVRDINKQIYFFKKYLDGTGNIACGPSKVRNELIRRLGSPPSRKADLPAYTEQVREYLEQNQTFLAKVEDPNRYLGCPHLTGQTVDLALKTSEPNKCYRLRELMCKNDWVNFGKEYWHYEYKTSSWKANRPDLLSDDEIGSQADNTYNPDCYYSTLKAVPAGCSTGGAVS